jgi:uncharacterized repeat protein (TIGR03803 family)
MPSRFRVYGSADIFIVLLVVWFLVVAKLPTHAQTYRVLHSFGGPTSDGVYPLAIIKGGNGTIFGTTCRGGLSYNGTAYELSPTGKETILYNFNAGYGSCPDSLFAWKGEFYGTAGGGTYRDGVLFKLDLRGNEVVLYNFGASTAAGIDPFLHFQNSAGLFYGTTAYGGTGSGTLFTADTSGKVTVIYNFPASFSGSSVSGLVADENGNLYGTMLYNGNSNCAGGCGSLFKLDAAGNFTTLYAFTGGADGAQPAGGLIRAEGNLYGTTSLGGITCGPGGCGTVFKFSPSGQLTTLYSFAGAPDGYYPLGNLVRDSAGNLYGTTFLGGDAQCHDYDYGGCGILFKIDPTGKETIVHTFTGAPGDGADGGFLLLDAAGDLYGTTIAGGEAYCSGAFGYSTCGTLFQLTP